jgi:hypothetical protein
MNDLIITVEIVFPAVMVGVIAYFIVHKFLQYEESRLSMEIEKGRMEIIFPARMHAYERIIMFLERSLPENLIRRTLKPGMSARQFQGELISTMRSEYEHNISQQIYMSRASWEMVKTSSEETMRLVNVAGTKLPPGATASELGEKMLLIMAQISKFPTHIAIEHVRNEFSQFFLNHTFKSGK